VNRPDRDSDRRSDWADWNRNRGDWDRDRNDWDRNRNDWNRNWDRDWNDWNPRYSGRYGGFTSPNYWNNYYRNGYYGSPFFGNNRYGYRPGYYGYGGYGLGGIVPGIGIGFGLGRLFGNTGYYGYGSRYGGYYPGYYDGDYYTGYRGVYTETPDVVTVEPQETTAAPSDFLESAREAFMKGDYAGAQKLAHHAVVDTPDDAKAHELMSLALFAQGNYVGAAEASHATIALGSVADWPTLYGYYNDREKYEQHFNALKQFAHDHPDAPEGKFLLGFHHFMMGHRDIAQRELADYLKLVDHQDPIGAKLYGDAGGDVNALPKPTAPPPLPREATEADGVRE
jgi:hypothetical protein